MLIKNFKSTSQLIRQDFGEKLLKCLEEIEEVASYDELDLLTL